MKSPVLLFGYEINKQKCKWSINHLFKDFTPSYFSFLRAVSPNIQKSMMIVMSESLWQSQQLTLLSRSYKFYQKLPAPGRLNLHITDPLQNFSENCNTTVTYAKESIN